MTQEAPEEIPAKRCNICGQRFTSDAAFCPFDGEKLADAPAFQPAADPLIGTLVDGRYEVLEALGEGGMGTVYRVRHKVLQRLFAMKVLRREVAREKDLCTRFIQEARTAATISHPNVVQITDYGQLVDGTPYFVMELLEGKPLSKMIKAGGPLPAARAVRIVEQIAGGVGAAHRAGVVHRDLKPDNVFVLETEGSWAQVKILDFGVAKVAGSASITRTGMVFGSPHYMSPEQASGQPVDHRADIYAVGVIMYELFTGRVPFEADTFMGVLTKHMFMAPESFEAKVGEAARELGALEDITLRCLEKKPENRFPTMDGLVAAIEEVVELGAGDRIDVRPSNVGSERRHSVPVFRLADEMEPPQPLEIKAARALRSSADRQTRFAIVSMIVAGCMLILAVGILLWVRTPQRVEVPVPAGSVPVATASQTVPIPVPTAAISTGAPTTTAAVVTDAAAAEVPTAHSTASKPPRTLPHPPSTTATAPPTTPPPAKTHSGSSEIVNPWE
ncbi:MAG: serine/threonine protein kinase [Deltaproteobacteria bacterium]|nr:serine/threonine protein kinase [Deltaproteobacteria bacterium]